MMILSDRIKNGALQIATFGNFGGQKMRALEASLLAYLVVFLGRMTYTVSVDLFYMINSLVCLGLFIILGFIFRTLPLDRHDDVVINRTVGMCLALSFRILSPGTFILALMLFHGARLALPILIEQRTGIVLKEVGGEGFTNFLTLDVLAGIATNLVLILVIPFLLPG